MSPRTTVTSFSPSTKDSPRSSGNKRPAWRSAPRINWECVPILLACLIPLGVYSLTLAPSVTLEDSAEYCVAAWTLSPAHPPGSPTWVLLAHLTKYIPLGTFVQRTNFLSAVCISLASLCLYLFIQRTIHRWEVALSAALIAAFSRCIWGQAVVTYNYSLNLMMILLCLVLAQQWRETGKVSWLAAVAFCGGLGVGVHHLFILLSPVILVYALWGKWRQVFQPKTLSLCLTALCLGLSVLTFLPIRMAQHPPIQWGAINSWASFWEYFSRQMYKEAEGGIWYSGNPQDALQFGLAFLKGLPREQGGLLCLFALPGIYQCWRKYRGLCVIFASMAVLNVPVLLVTGGSQFTPTSEYINRLYYLPATAALATFTGMGWWMGARWVVGLAHGWLTRSAHDLTPKSPLLKGEGTFRSPFALGEKGDGGMRFGFVLRAFILSALLLPLALNWKACDRSDYRIADEYARNLLRSIPSGCAVFPLTNNETFLLAYCRFVEGNPQAWLLDTRFGWDVNDVPKGLLTTWDVGKSSPHPIPDVFKEGEAFPLNILYLLQNETKPPGLEQFRKMQLMEYTIRQGPEEFPYLSPFERMIFASYSAYYVGLGARYHLEGQVVKRDQAWERAESLNPDDSYCDYLLGLVYEESKTHSNEEARHHYQKALDEYGMVYDPLDTRFYGVDEKRIRERLGRVE